MDLREMQMVKPRRIKFFSISDIPLTLIGRDDISMSSNLTFGDAKCSLFPASTILREARFSEDADVHTMNLFIKAHGEDALIDLERKL